MVKIAINGLGRIGRSVLRAKFEGNYENIQIVAANGPAKIEDHAHLIKYDSIHGRFNKDIIISENNIIIENQEIKILNERDPSSIDWRSLDVSIVLECSGKFNTRNQAYKHLESGAEKVLISAPCSDADRTVIYGVNNRDVQDFDRIISIGSCTTNALAPIAKILDDSVGIEYGFMTTIHSYTNDQNLIDASHSDIRRARSAATSIIPTKTGAAEAIGVVLPNLSGKLSGAAVRVPVPNVSLIDLCFTSKTATTAQALNNVIINSIETEYSEILSVSKEKLVSIDFNHNRYSSVFDPHGTNVTGQRFCRIISWYDNEWGFANRMLDIVNLVSKDL